MKSPQFVPDCVNENERKPHDKLNLKSSKNGFPRSNWNLWKLELTEIVWNGIELSVRPVPERGLPSRSRRGQTQVLPRQLLGLTTKQIWTINSNRQVNLLFQSFTTRWRSPKLANFLLPLTLVAPPLHSRNENTEFFTANLEYFILLSPVL